MTSRAEATVLGWLRRTILGHTRTVDAAAAVMMTGAIAVYVVSDRQLVQYFCYFGALVFNAASAVVAVRSAPRGARLVPGLIALGVSLAVLGDVLCKVFDAGAATTDLSVADPAWLASYVVLCAAMLVVLVRGGGDRRGSACLIVDGATVVAVSVIVCWTLAIGRLFTDATVPLGVRAVWAAFPVLQSVLLALVLLVVIGPRSRHQVGPGFAVGVALWLVTNILYVHAPSSGGLVAAGASWMVAVVLMARTAWLWRPTPEVLPEGRGSTWVAPVVIGVAPLLVPPAVEVASDLFGSSHHPALLAVGSAVLILLAFVRTARLMLGGERVLRELEQARDEAMAASRAKSMFVATMSHELRTPLTTVLACAEMIEDTPLTEHQHSLVLRMRRAGGLLQSLVEDILDFSRIEAGRLELSSVPYDLHDLAIELSESQVARAEGAGLRLDCYVGPDVPRAVVGDPGRLMQVAGNLLDNALKFTEQGRVRLELRRADEGPAAPGAVVWVQVVVTDTGIGIPLDRLDSVFSAFEQVDGSSTRRRGGSGLGLAITRQLVQLMGGSIRVRSELGTGSEFVAELPLVVGEATPAFPEVPAQAGPGRTVLASVGT